MMPCDKTIIFFGVLKQRELRYPDKLIYALLYKPQSFGTLATQSAKRRKNDIILTIGNDKDKPSRLRPRTTENSRVFVFGQEFRVRR
jgi:hypothetical protein